MNIRITKSIIPNSFTTTNMFCGFVSIIYSAQGIFYEAAILIIVAAVFDALDGVMARLTKSSSEFGVELDSLADLVSFGVAPSALVYFSYLHQFNIWGLLISSLLMICGALRLARFNVQLVGFDKDFFKGLPIPSQAITIASFTLIYYSDGKYIEPYHNFIIPLVALLSLLMVSAIKYDATPKLNKSAIKESPLKYIIILVLLVILIATKGYALFFIFISMILFGIFRQIINSFLKKDPVREENNI